MAIDSTLLQKLQDGLLKVGLGPDMLQIMNGKLVLQMKRNTLKLGPKAHQLAIQAAKTMGKRPILEFVEGLVDQLMVVMEEETKRRRPKPAGPASIWEQLPPELRPQDDAPEDVNTLRTPEQLYGFLGDFMSKNLGQLKFDEKTKWKLAQEGAKVTAELRSRYGLGEKEAANLAKIPLYDIFFLCDDSGSMGLDNRTEEMSKTLQETTEWATKFEESGVSIRFINYPDDSSPEYNNITRPEDVDDLITGVECRGQTKLGTALRRKVVEPLAKRLNEPGGVVKPRIIVIIVDGKPNKEPEECFREVIEEAKKGESLGKKWGEAATIFLLAIIGEDPGAKEFANDLRRDKDMQSMIYTSSDPLDKVKPLLEGVNDHAYKAYLMRFFSAALRH